MKQQTFQITVNGDAQQTAARTIAGLLEELGLHQRRVAVMVDGSIVRRANYPEHALADGNTIEIISLIGGG